MHARTLATTSLCLALTHCGGAQPANNTASTTTATTGTSAPANTASSSGGAASDDEVRTLLAEVLTPQLCPKLTGAYVGLSTDGSATGPAAGAAPVSGRWWIRQCSARVVGDRMQLSMGGPGWVWVDREAMGFRIRQYVLFEADASMSADLTVGYDRSRRVASLWMQNAQGTSANVVPRGVVSAEPTGLFATVVGAALPLTGASASQRATANAAEMGSQAFRDKLATGFTMTFSLATRQVDFMVGALGRGEVPERPFPSDTTEPWQVNQRSMVWPGGLDVAGPVDVSGGPQGLDVELEEGPGAVVRVACADRMTPYLDARLRDPSAQVPPPPSSALIEVLPGSGVRHVTLPAVMTCPTLLLIAPRADSQLPVKLRYRVAPEGSAPGSAGAGAGTPARPQRVRVQVLGASLRAQNVAGHDWDVVGGEADPYVVVAAVGQGREVDRTPSMENNNNPQWGRWLPGAYDLTRDFPLRFSVFDEDGTTDEVVGAADLDVTDVPNQAGEVALPLRTAGAVPVQTGTLRLRVEPVE